MELEGGGTFYAVFSAKGFHGYVTIDAPAWRAQLEEV